MTTDVPHVIFVTKSDLTGQEGHNIITRNIALAFARTDAVETTVVCPTPSTDLPPAFTDEVQNLVYIGPRSQNPSVAERVLSAVDTVRVLRQVVSETDPDGMVARLGPDTVGPALIALRYRLPYAVLARGTSHKRLRFSWLLTRIFWLNVRLATTVYAASGEIKDDADRVRRSDQRPATLLANAVDPNEFRPHPRDEARDSIGLDIDAEFVIGFVGSMKPHHRIEVLIRALGHLEEPSDVGVLLVGDGPELERYRSVAEEVGVENIVEFAGFVSHHDVPRYISACDVLYAVRSQESATPVKVFEYLACERPVIVRDIEELTFVTENDLGRTVPEPDSEAVADAIRDLREVDYETRKGMGKRGREFVEREYTWEAFARKVIDDLLP